MATTTPNKTLKVPSGFTYAYTYIAPTDSKKPTLLFIHGFPSTSNDWRFQIPYFSSLGYGVLAPDMLGYGGTSKPTDPAAYMGTSMASDVIAILDHEQITGGLVGIAHDWGTFVLSQLIIYHGERFDKYVFVSVPFTPPGKGMDSETVIMVNKATEQQLGYPCFGYWLFLNTPEAGKVIGDHWESFFDIIYAADPAAWKTHVGPVNAMRSFIESDSKIEVASYITPEDKAHFHKAFGADYSAPTCWYKRSMAGLGMEEERKALENGEIKNWHVGKKIDKETLLLVGTRDAACIAESSRHSMITQVEDGLLKIIDVDAGHWIQLEKADVLNKALAEFLGGANKSVL